MVEKKSFSIVKYIFLMALIVPAFKWIALQSAMHQNDMDARVEAPHQLPKVVSLVSYEDAAGVTERDFTAELIKRIGDSALIGIKTHLIEKQKLSGKAVSPLLQAELDKMSVDTAIIERAGHNIGLIKIEMFGHIQTAIIYGFSKPDQIARVVCSVNEQVDVPITSGTCNDKTVEAFGQPLTLSQ